MGASYPTTGASEADYREEGEKGKSFYNKKIPSITTGDFRKYVIMLQGLLLELLEFLLEERSLDQVP